MLPPFCQFAGITKVAGIMPSRNVTAEYAFAGAPCSVCERGAFRPRLSAAP